VLVTSALFALPHYPDQGLTGVEQQPSRGWPSGQLLQSQAGSSLSWSPMRFTIWRLLQLSITGRNRGWPTFCSG